MPIITLAEAKKADILHRGDLVFVNWYPDARELAQRLIVDNQKNFRKLPAPACYMQHVLVITHPDGGAIPGAAQAWKGWSMQPWRGREVDIEREYYDCELWIKRYTGWHDDAQRYEYCDRVIKECHAWYSFTGCIHTALGLFPKLPGGRFCSESAELPAEEMGINGGMGFVPEHADRVPPGLLFTSPLLHDVATVTANNSDRHVLVGKTGENDGRQERVVSGGIRGMRPAWSA